MSIDQQKNGAQETDKGKHEASPGIVVSARNDISIDSKKKFWRRRGVVVPLIILIGLYFSGILGFGYYSIKCGNPPALPGFAGSGPIYVGDFSYLLTMPLTSLSGGYTCTDQSAFPWVRDREYKASVARQDAQRKAAKQTAWNNIGFDIYAVKSGAVPGIVRSDQNLLSTEDGGRITETYINTATPKGHDLNDEFEVMQRRKIYTVADNKLCAITVKSQEKDSGFAADNNFCGEFTPRGLRVYSSKLLPNVSSSNPDYVVDIRNTQILVGSGPFISNPVTKNGITTYTFDKAKFFAFIDKLQPIDAKAKAALYGQINLVR